MENLYGSFCSAGIVYLVIMPNFYALFSLFFLFGMQSACNQKVDRFDVTLDELLSVYEDSLGSRKFVSKWGLVAQKEDEMSITYSNAQKTIIYQAINGDRFMLTVTLPFNDSDEMRRELSEKYKSIDLKKIDVQGIIQANYNIDFGRLYYDAKNEIGFMILLTKKGDEVHVITVSPSTGFDYEADFE